MQPKETKGVAIFEQHGIRRIQHEGRWWFSVVDVIAALTETKNPTQYWRDMKDRFKTDEFIVAISKCIQLKLPALDNKYRLVDCSDIENLVPILHAIPATYKREFGDIITKRSGIYAIVNTTTSERYIGSSIDIDTRFIQHRSELRRQTHHAALLQTAWNQYGEDSFELVFLEAVTDEADLAPIEQLYLDQEQPAYNTSVKAINQATFSVVQNQRMHNLLEILRQDIGSIPNNPLRQNIQIAVDFGIIVPGAKYHLLLEAEIAGITSWAAFEAFLMNK